MLGNGIYLLLNLGGVWVEGGVGLGLPSVGYWADPGFGIKKDA